LASIPRSKGVYLLGSQVSVEAWPPAIQSRTNVSAVGFSFFGSTSWASRGRPASVAAPARQLARRNSRRPIGCNVIRRTSLVLSFICLTYKLKLGAHEEDPKHISPTLLMHGRFISGHADKRTPDPRFLFVWPPAESSQVKRFHYLTRLMVPAQRTCQLCFGATLDSPGQHVAVH